MDTMAKFFLGVIGLCVLIVIAAYFTRDRYR